MARLIYHDPFVKVPQPKSPIVHIPADIRPYEFRKRRPSDMEADLFDRPTSPPEEVLTGYVHGKKASKLEERFAMALDFYGIDFIFQFEVQSAYSLPDEGKKIDFVVNDGGLLIALEIGASFVHDAPSKQQEEQNRQLIINPILLQLGIVPLGEEQYKIDYDRPYDLEDAKDLVAELFISV